MTFIHLVPQLVLTLAFAALQGPAADSASPRTPSTAPAAPAGASHQDPPKAQDDATKAQDDATKPNTPAPSEPSEEPKRPRLETAVLGGGCFWCLDAVYRRVVGVKEVVCGYSGGHAARPSYRMVQLGITGHAEVVQITFDPDVVSYERLLEIFWHCHDPTTLNAQGPDVGDEYRSIILVKDEAQAFAARQSMAAAQQEFAAPIVTEIVPLQRFWKAESYHQNYYQRNKTMPYCRIYIAPKLQKLGVRP